MNILVTGGAGFIGSHVCEALLKKGHAVWALDNLNDFYDPAIKQANLKVLSSDAFHFVEGDITAPEQVGELLQEGSIDQIIHLAARGGVRPSIQDPVAYHHDNVEGTLHVLEAARKHGVGKVLMASSSSVYGANRKVPFHEDDPVRSVISPYAASKLACESLGHVYHSLHGFDVGVLRFFTVYGPRQRPDLAVHKFTRMIEYGKPVPFYGDGQTARDYTFITDAVAGVVAATEKSLGYEIINLGSARSVTLQQMIQLLETCLDRKAVLNRLPEQPGDVPSTFADINKARSLLGYRPRISMEQGVSMFVDWFRSTLVPA